MFTFHTVQEALEDLKKGKIIIATDDPERENEGDLICAAQFATQEVVNFMASHAKGLICMPMSRMMINTLGLHQMVPQNTDNHGTAFTESIDHVSTSTGISAQERSITALKCAEDNAKPEDFRRPGHMFPLEAKPGGVLERQGHTEVTVDLLKLAGLKEVGLCCEIMREDGTMMRTQELKLFAQKHHLTFITIKDLIQYRKQYDVFIQPVAEINLPTPLGHFTLHGFLNTITKEQHVALVLGNVTDGNPVLCRVHSECLLGDVFQTYRCASGQKYTASMQQIAQEGRGILIYLRQKGPELLDTLKMYQAMDKGLTPLMDLDFSQDYSVAAQILKQLGVNNIQLITNNSQKIEQLTQCGIQIMEQIPWSLQGEHPSVNQGTNFFEPRKHVH